MSPSGMWRWLGRRLGGGGDGLQRQAPRPVRSSVLEYGRKRFVKSYRQHVALDFVRGLAIHQAATRSGAFRAPAPLQLLEEHDLIVWECLDGMVELREHLMRDVERRPQAVAARASLFHDAGRALRAIHEALRPSEPRIEHRPFRATRSGNAALDGLVASRLASSPLRALHWDFVCGNLFVVEDAPGVPSLVVVDATPNWYLHPPGDTGVVSPVYVDGGTLVFSLRCHPRFSPTVEREADAYVDAFIDGYGGDGVDRLDRATLLACGAEVARIYQDFADGRSGSGRSTVHERRFRLAAAERLVQEAARSMREQGARG
jgi:hypothetical protein